MSKQSFSERLGFKPEQVEISVRNEAPESLREYLVQTVCSLGYESDFMRNLLCQHLKKVPNKNNWSESNVYFEVVELLIDCQWYYVYDAIELFYSQLRLSDQEKFEKEINDFFLMNGIGWKLENGIIEFRGDGNFELELSGAILALEAAKQNTAKIEIKEAITDLSRRPKADITGAIQHSLACLECVVREVAGNNKMTLGELIKKHSSIVPKPLDEAISRIWGYTSEQGRHLREGGEPDYDEAELVVGLSAVISTYLAKRLPKT
jgi:hypothetical protein